MSKYVKYNGKLYRAVDVETYDIKKNLAEILRKEEEQLQRIIKRIDVARSAGDKEALEDLERIRRFAESAIKSTKAMLGGKFPSMAEIYKSARKAMREGRIR